MGQEGKDAWLGIKKETWLKTAGWGVVAVAALGLLSLL